MSNDLNDAKSSEDSVSCIALSKNDSYVMSASGGKVSLFNMMTFKVCRPLDNLVTIFIVGLQLHDFYKICAFGI